MTNPYAPPQASVYDIAEPAEGHEPAGRGTRLGASLIDGLILSLIIVGPFVVGIVGGTVVSGEPSEELLGQLVIGAGLVAVIGFAAWCWITYRFAVENSQTIAKRMLGIKVVRTDGSRASVARLFWLRNVVNGLLGFIPLYAIIDSALIFGESRQCVHDKLADTIVVKA